MRIHQEHYVNKKINHVSIIINFYKSDELQRKSPAN